MIDTSTLPENPYVSLDNETIGIRSGNKKYKFKLEKIRKMYVTKRKPGQFSSIFSSILFLREAGYNVCIQTLDGSETKIKIGSLQRFYFIRLISMIRNINANQQSIA